MKLELTATRPRTGRRVNVYADVTKDHDNPPSKFYASLRWGRGRVENHEVDFSDQTVRVTAPPSHHLGEPFKLGEWEAKDPITTVDEWGRALSDYISRRARGEIKFPRKRYHVRSG